MKRIILRAVVPGLMSLAVVAWLIAYSPSQVGGANPVIPIGDVMVSLSGGAIDEFTPAGTLVQTLNTGSGGANTGSAFDSNGNFWVTIFDTGLTEFDPTGALIGAAAAPSAPESVLFDAAGHIWLGQADPPKTILELSANGSTQLNAFTVAVEGRGTDWIDLAADQCTMHYTSEGKNVLSYNVCTSTQNADFSVAPLPGTYAFAHRILPFAVGALPAGSELVANTSEVAVLNNAGVLVRDDTAVGSVGGLLFALNLDPDGTSYWTADAYTGEIWRADIATGTVLTHFTTSPGEGLSVKGQISAAVPTPTATGTPSPTPAAMATAAPPANITSAPGAMVTAGTLMVTNNSGATMVTPKVTISFANADLFSSATLTGVVGETQSTATASPITGGNSPEQANSTDFNLTPPLNVPNGQTATYTLTVTVSNNPKVTMRRSPVKYAAMIPGEGLGGSGGFLAAMLLLSLGTTLVAKSRPRRMFFALVIVMLAVTSQVGCDTGSGGSGGGTGSGGGGGGSVPASMQTVEGVEANNLADAPIIVGGLPIVLDNIKVP